ncbi:hypothetical protein [Cryptosporangium sp. NPDC051539]|uniref:hypothetical protein n=1 Tax=Cryptosporangium sp. NPDC051539 TaxID=3363962 RepID=UPI0037AB23A9
MAAAVLVVGAACTGPAPRPVASLPPDWRAVALPAPGIGPAEVSDLVSCAGHWFAVGSTGAAGHSTGPDATRGPAAWVSTDGRRFVPLPVGPRSVYGRVSRLYAAACVGPDLAALGAGVGGVHGNPRTAAWRLSGGVLRELPAPFELFGGPDALSVDRVAGGPAGWLVVGGRVLDTRGGAAAWRAAPGTAPSAVPGTAPSAASSADPGAAPAGEFEPASVPGALVSAPGEQTAAADAAALGGGWLIGGATSILTGADAGARRPLAWASTPGGWRREPLPSTGTGTDAGIDRVAAAGSEILAAGTEGDHFVLWRRTASGHWTGPATVASYPGSSAVLPRVRSLSADGSDVALAAGDGHRLRLWTSRDTGRTWRETPLPGPATDSGEARYSVTLRGDAVLLTLGNGDVAQLWGISLPA